MGQEPEIVLFHYTFSPFARRIAWYLTLRGISYTQCLQPPVMPRPDLAALGVKYRRIPVLAIGKDIYCDTRLILQKLEERFPEGALGAKDDEGKALEKLLELWTVDGGVFIRATQLMPPDLPLVSDPKFIKDRQDLSGRRWDKESLLKFRGEALVHVRQAFDFLETTLLADSRNWIRKTEKPTLSDLQAVWPLDWVVGMKGALDPNVISEKHYPKVFAWITRFRKAVSAAKNGRAKPKNLSGDEMLDMLQHTTFAEVEGEVDKMDPLRLQKGQEVAVWATDIRSSQRDTGKLTALNAQEVVLQRKTADERFDVRIHFPRTNFRIVAANNAQGSKL